MTTLPAIRCGGCGADLSHETPDGRYKLRTKLVAFRKGGDGEYRAEMPCPRCGGDVPLPIRFVADLTRIPGRA